MFDTERLWTAQQLEIDFKVSPLNSMVTSCHALVSFESFDIGSLSWELAAVE
jgi:hypothetical protein